MAKLLNSITLPLLLFLALMTPFFLIGTIVSLVLSTTTWKPEADTPTSAPNSPSSLDHASTKTAHQQSPPPISNALTHHAVLAEPSFGMLYRGIINADCKRQARGIYCAKRF